MITITGYNDGWFRIHGIEYDVSNEAEAQARGHAPESGWVIMPNLSGWIHANLVSVNFEIGGDIVLYDSAEHNAKVMLRQSSLKAHKLERILECKGRQLKVRLNNRIGWVRAYCGNPLTTCP